MNPESSMTNREHDTRLLGELQGSSRKPSHAGGVKLELVNLLARVEAASEPSVELFLAVARTLLPDTFTAVWDHDAERVQWKVNTFGKFIGAGAWTDAALALCERVLPGKRVLLDTRCSQTSRPAVAIGDTAAEAVARDAATLTLACLAAMLKALVAQAQASPTGESGEGKGEGR